MATGSQSDILVRLQAYLPRGWFGDYSETPVLNGVLTAIANTFAIIYTLIMFAWANTRLQTSTGGWIDLWAADFLGTSLPRHSGESDAAYILRVKAAVLQPRATRQAMVNVLTNLTGRAPIIFEPNNPNDSGCLGKNTGSNSFFGVARFGSIACPYSALITAYRAKVTGTATAGGAFFDAASVTAFNSLGTNNYLAALGTSLASDSTIYAAINATRPIGSNIGVYISN